MRTHSSILFAAAIVAVSMAASTAQSWSQSPEGTGANNNASVRAVDRSSSPQATSAASRIDRCCRRTLKRRPLNSINSSEALTGEIRHLPCLGLPLSRRFEYFETACCCMLRWTIRLRATIASCRLSFFHPPFQKWAILLKRTVCQLRRPCQIMNTICKALTRRWSVLQ